MTKKFHKKDRLKYLANRNVSVSEASIILAHLGRSVLVAIRVRVSGNSYHHHPKGSSYLHLLPTQLPTFQKSQGSHLLFRCLVRVQFAQPLAQTAREFAISVGELFTPGVVIISYYPSLCIATALFQPPFCLPTRARWPTHFPHIVAASNNWCPKAKLQREV